MMVGTAPGTFRAPHLVSALVPQPDPRPPVLVVGSIEEASVPEGWSLRDGFDLPSQPWDLSDRGWLCGGRIEERADMARAVEALDRGVALAVEIRVTGRDRLDLFEDLHRAGRIIGQEEAPLLTGDQRGLLEALIGGATVAEAACEAGLSLRTAHRRLADARRRLGVTTTTAAVVAAGSTGARRSGGAT